MYHRFSPHSRYRSVVRDTVEQTVAKCVIS